MVKPMVSAINFEAASTTEWARLQGIPNFLDGPGPAATMRKFGRVPSNACKTFGRCELAKVELMRTSEAKGH